VPATTKTNVTLAEEADRLGYSVAWVAEAYGSDSPTVLSWVGARTQRIHLGAAVMQIPARSPAMTAMTAATLDSLSGGRFRLGLGVSGPQVSEGWHGVRFDAPLGRTREYVDIVRMALRRDVVSYEGRHFTLPLPDGPGKALKLGVRPVRDGQIPIYLAAVGPKNLELTGEIADGWLAIFFSPEFAGDLIGSLETGARRAGKGADGPRRSPASTSCPPCPSSSPTTSTTRMPRSPVMPRSTSGAWGRGRRTSTTNSPAGWASRRRPSSSRTSTSPARPGMPRRRSPGSSSTPPACSGRASGSGTGWRHTRRRG
jgi:hypothetical protein